MTMIFPDASAQEMHDEFSRTGVLSKEWKDHLIVLLMSTVRQAYQRGEEAEVTRNARKAAGASL